MPTLPKAALTPALHTEKGPGLGGPWAWLTEAAAQYLLRDAGGGPMAAPPVSQRGTHHSHTPSHPTRFIRKREVAPIALKVAWNKKAVRNKNMRMCVKHSPSLLKRKM